MLEWDVQKGGARLGQHLGPVEELRVDVRAPAAASRHPGADDEVTVDRDRLAIANEDPGRYRREAMPGGEQPARLVERGRDETSVDKPGPRLVSVVEAEAGLVLLRALLRRLRQMDSGRVVAAAPAGRVVVRRDAAQRNPPCWKCALKKFSEPAVAIAAEAEISSASVAAATICAKRYTLPDPAQPISPSHERA